MTKTEFGSSIFFPTRSDRISVGVDSVVYRFGDFVVKEYPRIQLDTLLAYQQFTNKTSQSLCQNPLVNDATIEGVPWHIQFFVAPILEISTEPPFRTKSPYVAGPDMFSLLNQSKKRAPFNIMELYDINEQSFLLKLMRLLANEDFRKSFTVLTSCDEVIARVVGETGVGNLTFIDQVNTKLRANLEQKVLSLTITDLGSRVKDLTFPTLAD